MSEFPLPPRQIVPSGDDSPARSLLRYVWRMSGWHQPCICLLAVATAALTAAPLELQRRIVDDVIVDGEIRLLWLLAGVYLVVLVVQGITKYALRLYQGWLSESAIRYNRAHLARLYAGWQEENGRGEENGHEGQAVSVIGAEVDKLGGFVGEGLSQPCTNLAMVFAIGGYMLVVEPLVALFSLAFVLPQIVLLPLVQRYINRLVAERVTLLRDLGAGLTSLSPGGGEELDVEFRGRLDSIYDNRLRTFALKFSLKAANNFLSALAPLTVLLVGGIMVIEGETSLGVVVAFISGFDRLTDPLRELIAYYRVAAQANVQHRMIARWM